MNDRAPDFLIPAGDDVVFGWEGDDLHDGPILSLPVASLAAGLTVDGCVLLFIGVATHHGVPHKLPAVSLGPKDARILHAALADLIGRIDDPDQEEQ
jgi:hypothetical protein